MNCKNKWYDGNLSQSTINIVTYSLQISSNFLPYFLKLSCRQFTASSPSTVFVCKGEIFLMLFCIVLLLTIKQHTNKTATWIVTVNGMDFCEYAECVTYAKIVSVSFSVLLQAHMLQMLLVICHSVFALPKCIWHEKLKGLQPIVSLLVMMMKMLGDVTKIKKYCLHCLASNNKRQTEDNATLHEVIHSIYHLMNVLADTKHFIQKKHATMMTMTMTTTIYMYAPILDALCLMKCIIKNC